MLTLRTPPHAHLGRFLPARFDAPLCVAGDRLPPGDLGSHPGSRQGCRAASHPDERQWTSHPQWTSYPLGPNCELTSNCCLMLPHAMHCGLPHLWIPGISAVQVTLILPPQLLRLDVILWQAWFPSMFDQRGGDTEGKAKGLQRAWENCLCHNDLLPMVDSLTLQTQVLWRSHLRAIRLDSEVLICHVLCIPLGCGIDPPRTVRVC